MEVVDVDRDIISSCNGFSQKLMSTYTTLEGALYSKENSVVDKSTVWRQQSLLKCFNETVSNDVIERHWARRDLLIDNNVLLNKHLNVIQSLLVSDVKSHKAITFPNMDEVDSLIHSNKEKSVFDHTRMFSSNDRQATTVSQKPSYLQNNLKLDEGSSSKPRNTIESFVQRQTPAKNHQESFYSARQLLIINNLKKNTQIGETTRGNLSLDNNQQKQDIGFNFAATKKSLGSLGRVVNTTRKNFVSPVRSKSTTSNEVEPQDCERTDTEIAMLLSHPALKNVDPKMVELINNEVIPKFKPVDWNEIAGLEYAKSIIKEAVVYPLLRPDIFTGLRKPPRGILLFGPPGTGKTLIGKCIASQSSSTFFSISSASLTSKWMGDGEKMVRALFAVAVARQPSVIFIDEIDSLLSQRSENENEGTRRLKTEFLVRLDGTATSDDDRVLIVGATNRPQELDDAVRRRFVKRLYVPLPEINARTEILINLLKSVENNLNINEVKEVSHLAEGYSGADMDSLCREASMEPLRSLPPESIITFNKENLRPVNINDFYSALKKIRSSVSANDLNQYVEWNKTYGSSY